MAAPAAVLSILVRANTGAATTGLIRINQQLADTDKHGKRVARTLETVAKGVALVGAGAAVGGIIYATKKAADFEQQLSSLGAVTEASGKQMERFRKQALKAGADTKFSALEAAQAQTELAKGGLKTSQILRGGLSAALALAAAGELDLADAASTTANAMNLFGLRGRQSMKVADMLAKAANATTADVSDFAMALSQGGSVAKSAGLSFKETVLALEALAKSGIKNSDAGTSLKTSLIQLIKPTATQKELADKLNISFIDQAGHFKDLADVSTMLRARLGDMTKAQRTSVLATLAGTDGVRTLTALYDAGAPRLNKWSKGLEEQGTAAEVARKKQDNLKGTLENLHGSFETLAIQVGTGFIPVIRDVAKGLTGLSNDIGKILSRKDLTLGEKLQRSLDVAKVRLDPWIDKLTAALDRADIPEKLGVVLSAAVPIIAKAAAKGGLIAAKSFVQGFLAADIWGRLVVGAWLLSRMGGPPAFLKLGSTAGTAMAGGMSQAFGVKVASSGLKGNLVNLFKSWGPTLAIALGLTFGPELVKQARKAADQARPETRAKRAVEGIPKSATRSIDTYTAAVERSKDAVKSATNGTNRMHLAVGLLKQQANQAAGAVDKLAAPVVERLAMAERKAAGMSDRFASSIRGLRLKGTKDFKGLVDQVTFGSQQILKVGGSKSEQTQREISRQFRLARNRVKQALDDTVINTKQAGSLLHQLAVKQLALYGIHAGRVNVVLARGAPNSPSANQMRPHARGGHIDEGKPSGDSVPALLEKGEYVLNRKAVGKVGKGALDRLNFGAAPRFQSGGLAGLKPGVASAARSVLNRFTDLMVTSTTGGTHAPGSYHYQGNAVDIAGSSDSMFKASSFIKSTMGSSLTEGIHNPNLSIKFGKNVSPGFWGASTWAGHANHIHMAVVGALKALGMPDIARVVLKGPPSVALEAAQGALDRIRSAAMSSVASAVMGQGPGAEAGAGMDATGNGAGLMKAISAARGWNFGDWWALDAAETSHGANLSNPTSTARLRGQFLSSNYGKYGPGSDPAQNPSMAEQIQSMAQYIAERYGNPTKAWEFHQAHNWYRQGGLVGRLTKTLKTVRSAKSPKLRKAAVDKLLDRVKAVGLSDSTRGNLRNLSKNADVYGDYADRASQLSGEDANGNPIPAKVNGRTQSEWLQLQLETLFKWRNALIRAEKHVADKREKIAKAIEVARKRLKDARDQAEWVTRTRKRLEKQLLQAKKHPKQNAAEIKKLKGQIKSLDSQGTLAGRTAHSLRDRILPGLIDKRRGLVGLRGTLLENLQDVQGAGSPMGVRKVLPTVGVLGGRIFDVQMALRDLNAPRTTTTDTSSDSERDSLLEQLLRESTQRYQVSQAQYKVLNTMPQFATGGIVPGATGQAVPAVVHAGEGVFTRDQMAAMGGSTVTVNVAPGMEWLKQFITVQVDQQTRRNARHADRKLPGRGGGITR